jgi:hypothetical protein
MGRSYAGPVPGCEGGGVRLAKFLLWCMSFMPNIELDHFIMVSETRWRKLLLGLLVSARSPVNCLVE